MNQVLNTVFVLGAGFSCEQGYPLVRAMKDEVICFLNRKKHVSYWARMQPDCRYAEGRFYADLEGYEELPFEELFLKLAERLKCKSEDPYPCTSEVLRIGAVGRLWEVHESCKDIKQQYKNFAKQLWTKWTKWKRCGIISFNWDLQAERLLEQAEVRWGYSLNAKEWLPVIKPHGSINWSGHLREGSLPLYSGWQPIRADSKLSFYRVNPLANPDLDNIHPNLRYMIFPGDPNLSDSDEDVALLWDDAACLLDNAEEVVFIGYSFPDYDTYARRFFRNRVQGKKVIAVNPSKCDLQKFESLLGAEAAKTESREEKFSGCPYSQPTTDT